MLRSMDEIFLINQQKMLSEHVMKTLKIAIGQGDHYTTGCLLAQPFLEKYYRIIDKQEELDADPKAIQQISFTGNLDQEGNTEMFLITEETKETILEFSRETVIALCFFSFYFNVISVLNYSI